jgi:imidazolonepropionase-like amidohydrolase
MEAIVAATRTGAETLRIGDLTGTLEAGKSADLLGLAANPLNDISALADENIALVVREGEIQRGR